MIRSCLFVVLLPVWVSGCAHMVPAPHPLYAGPARVEQELALLSGPVQAVDGIDVSNHGSLFSLLPGCHIVKLRSRIGEGDVGGAWSVDTHGRVYAFRMRAGHSYDIEVRLLPGKDGLGTSAVGGAEIKAIERDANGSRLQTVARVHGEADIESCRSWSGNDEDGRQVSGDQDPAEPPRDATATATVTATVTVTATATATATATVGTTATATD
jgi:hypothetical protein